MFPVIISPDNDRLRSGITWFNPLAIPLFERALRRGNFRRLIDRLLRRSWLLPLLGDAIAPDMTGEAPPVLTQAISLNAIRGSANRSADFDCRFLPLDEHLQNRWVRVASMMLQGTSLPPVELIRVRDMYFVVDGHHRISVARMLRHTTIDAIICQAYD